VAKTFKEGKGDSDPRRRELRKGGGGGTVFPQRETVRKLGKKGSSKEGPPSPHAREGKETEFRRRGGRLRNRRGVPKEK